MTDSTPNTPVAYHLTVRSISIGYVSATLHVVVRPDADDEQILDIDIGLYTAREKRWSTTTENRFVGVGWFSSSSDDVRKALASAGVDDGGWWDFVKVEAWRVIEPHADAMFVAARDDARFRVEPPTATITIITPGGGETITHRTPRFRPTLRELQRSVDGCIEAVDRFVEPGERARVAYANEDGLNRGMLPNFVAARRLNWPVAGGIVGPVVICEGFDADPEDDAPG